MLTLAAVGGSAATATAVQPAAGLLDHAGSSTLALFDSDSPAAPFAQRAVTGLAPGEQLEALDFRDRPLPGAGVRAAGLYGLGVVHGAGSDTARLYRVDLATGAAAAVGRAITGLPSSTSWDVDFDAVSDQLRVVNDADLNLRINPDSGAAVRDADLTPGGGAVGAIAYSEEDVPQRYTTLHALSHDDRIGLIGGWRGAPSANGGSLNLYGSFGVTSLPGSRLGLDYTPYPPGDAWAQQTGFATVATGPSATGLYRLQYSMGSGESLGFVGDLAAPLRGFALLPADTELPATVQFEVADLTTEEQGSATVTVTRSGPLDAPATVAFATANGTATAGDDYESAAGTLAFAAGQRSASFEVLLVPDDLSEQDETVLLSLSDPSAPLTLGAPARATLTIRDGDDGLVPPRLSLSGVPRQIRLATLLRRGLKVRVTPSKPVGFVEATLVGTARRAQISRSGRLVLARAFHGPRGSAPRTLTLKPPRRLVGHPSHAVRLRVIVTAHDRAGQPAYATKVLRVTVP